MQKLTPCLWFNFNAEEAIEFYLSVFKDGKVLEVSHYGPSTPQLEGKVLTMTFSIAGQELQALNAGPQFPFTEAISLSVSCADQAEVDRLWAALTAGGGSPGQCGWLKDRFGLSWQLVPSVVPKMLTDSDPARRERVFGAIMKMTKPDFAALQAAYDGR
jgi:predicted 3-demethylubiquinone-9 3-methyltransferase (glyoxalase superfamily)